MSAARLRARLAAVCVALHVPLAAATATEPADLLLHDARIVTVDAQDTRASALAVRDGRILALGGEELRERFRATRVVDLDGRTVLPGFIDTHTHVTGRPRRFIDLSGSASIAAIQQAVRAKIAELPPGEWITGYGWSEDQLAEGRRPLRADLDAAAPGNPVLLARAGDHSAVVNSRALAIAGIDRDTPDPDGGVIERGADREPNGVIRERQDLVARHIPAAEPAELRASLVENLAAQFRLGITSIVDAQQDSAGWQLWQDVYREHGARLPRASVQLEWEGLETMQRLRAGAGAGDTRLRLGAVKIFVDGGFTGPAAYTLAPYAGEHDYRGHLRLPEQELRALIREVHDAGWQLGIHAIGDAAIALTVDALAAAIEANPRADHRHYLNHFSMRPPERVMRRMALLQIAITQQPNFTYTLEGRYAAHLEGWRLQHNNPLRTPLAHGIHLALSSDILPSGPALGLYAAVTRRGMSGKVYGADEALTLAEAIRGYTLSGAWLTREEQIKGSLEPGKLADFVVLEQDPFALDALQLKDLAVHQTWLGGTLVYQQQ